LLLDLHQ